MSQEKLKEILKQGMYGSPEIRPEERKLFLSTISERVYLALTNSQVRHKGIYSEAEDIMKTKKDVRLYINGQLNYSFYSNYIQAANKHRIPFTVINDGHPSPLGVVLASDKPVYYEEKMFITDELYRDDMGSS